MSGPSTPTARGKHTVAPLPSSTPARVIRPLDCAVAVTIPHTGQATLADGSMDQVLLYQGRPISLAVFLEANPGAIVVS